MNKILTFFFFCISFVLISGSETLQVDKELCYYKELLSEISLTLALLEYILTYGRKKIREAHDLAMALKNYEMILKSDNIIYKFCGSIERVEGEHHRYRILNIFRRDTRNPFAEITIDSSIIVKRMIKRREWTLPTGTGKPIRDRWSDLIDSDLVHFSFNENSRTADLDEFIINRNIEKVKELLNEKFIEQDGVLVLDFGITNFSYWEVRSRGNIFHIDRFNYKSAFININEIKFIRK